MVGHRRAPGVPHGCDADPGAKMLRIGGDGDQRLGGRLEEDVVDHGPVLVGDVGDWGREREKAKEVRGGQEIGLALGEPLLCGCTLALRAMPVAAAVVGDRGMRAQSAQRATWPPSAAVRQRSMADMTLSWPRLTWPALAMRQAAPWSRKMSATSRAGRTMSACTLCRRRAPHHQALDPFRRKEGFGRMTLG